MAKLVIKVDENIIDTRYGSVEALKAEAKRLREYYKRAGYSNYKISVRNK